MRFLAAILSMMLVCAVACDRDEPGGGARNVADDDAPAAAATRKLPRVVFLGDSITAGYGVDRDEAFPALVALQLEHEGLPIDAVNAGSSGDTTAGGLRRLDWVLRQKPDVVVVGLGGNDGLRGQDVTSSEKNLRAIVKKSQDAGAAVLLLGMMIPPSYGPEYATEFRDMYPRLAKELAVPLVPFLLEGVGGEVKMNQRDGIHPTPQGHERVAANVLPHLRAILQHRAGSAPVTRLSPAQ